MTQLLFFPIPRTQESALSLLYRCATGNGLSTEQLMRDINSKRRHSKLINGFWRDQALCSVLSSHPLLDAREKSAVEECFYKAIRKGNQTYTEIAGISVPATVLRNDLALCPGCARDGHLNIMHTLNFSDICPIHGEVFLLNCPQCGQKLIWHRVNDYHCSCGFNLRLSPTAMENNNASKHISSALTHKDGSFFSLLITTIAAMHYIHTPENRNIILESCTKIATGNKSVFFREIEKLQEFFPSLHRRTLLAPLLLSSDSKLNEYAQEYLFSACQSRPKSHPLDCRCGELEFSGEEIKFIFSSAQSIMTLRNKHLCQLSPPTQDQPNGPRRFNCPQLCKTLFEDDDVLWEKYDDHANPIPRFELIDHLTAAELLATTPQTVRRVINSGLLKGFKLEHSFGLVTSMDSLKKFNNAYVLRSEIVRRSGLHGNQLRTLLLNLAPIVIRTTRYAGHLLVYQRKHLPVDLRARIDKQSLGFQKRTISPEGMISFQAAALRLNMSPKDLRYLKDMGILDTAPSISKKGELGMERCTPGGLEHALSWRKNHVSPSEIDAVTGCDSRLIHSRFIKTGFIDCVKLHSPYIALDDAKKIARHYKKYISASTLQTRSGYGPGTISSMIELGKIHPLPHEHPDSIPGIVLITLEEAQSVFDKVNVKHPRQLRTLLSRPSPKAKHRRYNHYLTSPATIEALTNSICSPAMDNDTL